MQASNIISALVGAAVGSGVTFIFCKKRFEKLMDEEAEAFREALEEDDDEETVDISEEEKAYVEKDIEAIEEIAEKARQKEDYNKIASKYQKTPQKEDPENEDDKESEWVAKVYYITEDEFGSDQDNYDSYCASFYSDGILADDIHDHEVDPEHIKHLDIREQFDKGVELLYIRDDSTSSEYEVQYDERTFAQMLKEKEE